MEEKKRGRKEMNEEKKKKRGSRRRERKKIKKRGFEKRFILTIIFEITFMFF